MTWVAALPGAVVLALLWFVPGSSVLRLLGIRGLSALGAGPPVTAALVGVLAVAYDRAGAGWSLPSFAAGVAAVIATLALGRRAGAWLRDLRGAAPAARGVAAARSGATEAGLRAVRPGVIALPPPLGRRAGAGLLLALAVGAVLVAGPVMGAIGQADRPEQAWDAVFHLNATALVRETGDASLLGSLGPMYGGTAGYYPTVWHAVAALAPGLDVPAAANVQNLVLGALVWPLGLAALTRVSVRSPAATILVPLLASALVVFPTVALTVLALWPYGLSVAILPGALTALLVALGTPWRWQAKTAAIVAAVLAAAGVVLAHASGMFSLLVLGGPVAAVVLTRHGHHWWRAGRPRVVAAVAGALVLAALVGGALLRELPALRSTLEFTRTGSASYLPTLGKLVADVPLAYDFGFVGLAAVPITALGIAGAVLAVRRRRSRWLVLAWALTVALTLLAAGPEWNPLRAAAGPWYTQAGRIGPLAAVPALVLAAAALAELGRWLTSRRSGRERRAEAPAIVVLAVLVVALSAARWGLRADVTAAVYQPGEIAWGSMMTDEEIEMQRRLGAVLPPDALVLGDPFNGSAYLPALAGVAVVHPQLGHMSGQAHRLLLGPDIDLDDRLVCEAIRSLGVTHLYTDTAGADDGAKVHERGAGLRALDPPSAGVEPVDTGGTASLWRMPAC